MYPALAAKYHLTAEDEPFVASVLYFGQQQGWSREKTEEIGLGWFAEKFKPGMTPAAAFQSFTEHAAERGADDRAIQMFGHWYDSVSEHGVEAHAPPPPTPQQLRDDEVRHREIAEIRRTDPAKYWRDEGLQREDYEILARAEGSPVPAPAAATPSDSAARLSEIKNIMQTDRAKYWRDEGMQKEYAQLLEAAQPQPQPGETIQGSEVLNRTSVLKEDTQ